MKMQAWCGCAGVSGCIRQCAGVDDHNLGATLLVHRHEGYVGCRLRSSRTAIGLFARKQQYFRSTESWAQQLQSHRVWSPIIGALMS